jgi:choline dehydrogenase
MHDFVIVGAGTAGCALAHELTAGGAHTVALIEAGGAPNSPFVKIPAGFAKLFKSPLDWNYESAPDARTGRSVYIPRGRMLGGSSNLNAQIHQWGHPADFDAWRDAGATGWGWEHVAPILRAQETLAAATSGRGATGPLRAVENPAAHPLSRAFVTSYRALGGPQTAGYNGTAFAGAWVAEIAQYRGERFSAYDGFLKPVLRHRHLHVLVRTTALRVLFEGRRATGVVVVRDGVQSVVRARKGVIACAGAFGSPQLLMCSGVGPGEDLRTRGIPVVHACDGVGRNLHDHPMVVPVFRTNRSDTLKTAESPANLLRYLLTRSGPLSSNAVEAIAFASLNPATGALPDIELLFAPFEWRNEGLDAPRVHAFSIGVAAIAPRSRGKVTLHSSDARQAPLIDLGLLSDADGFDRSVLIAGVALARRVAGQAPLAASMIGEDEPSHAGEDAVSRWIDQHLQTVYHPAGTCRMGDDANAVTDARLAVDGVDGLWVADASIMPSPIRGHPNAAVAMIAQRAAGFVAA